jgi:SAM-dependent methyltransferase
VSDPRRVDPTARFGKTAEDYERYRPGYPLHLVDWVAETCHAPKGARGSGGVPQQTRLVDLGAGTGISARLFAGCGYDVVGVEPSEEMRERAAAVGGARYVEGCAEATGLPDASADLVIAGQAFHWFEREPTMREIARLLAPGSPSPAACAFWNVRAKTAALREYDAVLKEFVARYDERPTAEPTMEAIEACPGVTVLGRTELANVQQLDREGLLGRAHSSSYVAHDAINIAGLDRALGQLFDKHSRGGAVDFAYRTLAIAWTIDIRKGKA